MKIPAQQRLTRAAQCRVRSIQGLWSRPLRTCVADGRSFREGKRTMVQAFMWPVPCGW